MFAESGQNQFKKCSCGSTGFLVTFRMGNLENAPAADSLNEIEQDINVSNFEPASKQAIGW
jgi:hypothetical protein